MNPANAHEAMREVAQDLSEGADMVMVKPALLYLDVIYRIVQHFAVPTMAFHVSGEYAMIQAAHGQGWLSYEQAIFESTLAISSAAVSLGKVWDWLDGKNCRSIEKHIAVARDLELDNEKRAVKIIKKFELKVDLVHYVKKANAYVQFYNWMLITRKWSKPKNSPYKNKNLVNAMSNKFNMKYDYLTPKLEKIFRTENI
jgi:hypothetical protein